MENGSNQSVIRAVHLEYRVLFGCISASLKERFLKIHTSHFPRMLYKICKFISYRSIIKDSLFETQCAFSAVTRLPLKRHSCIFVTCTPHAYTTNVRSLVPICQKLRALCIKAVCPLDCILDPVGGIFQEIRTSRSPRVLYKRCKFGWAGSIIIFLKWYIELVIKTEYGHSVKLVGSNWRLIDVNGWDFFIVRPVYMSWNFVMRQKYLDRTEQWIQVSSGLFTKQFPQIIGNFAVLVLLYFISPAIPSPPPSPRPFPLYAVMYRAELGFTSLNLIFPSAGLEKRQSKTNSG
jgi:hypothetical protein